ncbi:MAG: DNA methyltransferase, partial [Chloroflexi bacterium]|nr:DNA methyltransferase [Chloroflexota bacterium]
MNRTLFAADCLDILNDSAVIPDASVDLIYLDPPFNSNSKYNLPFKGKDKNHKPVEAFVDIWKWSDQDAEALDDLRRNPKTRPLATIIKFAQDVELMSGKQRKGTSLASYLLNMAVRLRAMRRVLKETGSIYLHCDPTASHYLKLLMDAIYGNSAFRSEIIWRRHAHSHSLGAKQWPAIHDVLLMYTKGKKWSWNTQHKDYTADYIRKSFRYSDENGPYQAYPITGARPGGQEAYEAWRGRTPSTSRAWALPRYSLLPNWINLPSEEEWSKLSIHSKLDCLDDAGLIHWPRKKGGQPALKRYQRDAPGKIIEDIWTEIGVRVGAKENLGYPTQKPLALLERIIRASSNEGDT